MELKGLNVLVTGAGGFIGSHLVERLVKEEARVHAFIRYTANQSQGNLRFILPELFRQLKITMGDLRDPEAVRAAVRNMDIVFHLGALIAIPYSYKHPREVIETNVMGTLNIMTAAHEFEVSRIVHTSTSEVYGSAQYVPIDESHPLQGQSPYSASKIGADMIAESFFRSFGVPLVTLRPFNTYGPRQSDRAVIPTIIAQSLTQKEIQLGSLEPERDFTFVTDTVEGFLRAATAENVIGQDINVGNDAMISIGDLVKKIHSVLGRYPELVVKNERVRPSASEVVRLRASNLKARTLLGWRPIISLDEGLRITCEWMTSHLDQFKPEKYAI